MSPSAGPNSIGSPGSSPDDDVVVVPGVVVDVADVLVAPSVVVVSRPVVVTARLVVPTEVVVVELEPVSPPQATSSTAAHSPGTETDRFLIATPFRIERDNESTPWLTEIIWSAANRVGHGGTFVDEVTAIQDDHIPFLRAGVPAVDIIDLDYPAWHTPDDDLPAVSSRGLQIVGEVLLAALPEIEKRLTR